MKLTDLEAERAGLLGDLEQLVSDAESGNRDLTASERKIYEQLVADIATVDRRLNMHDTLAQARKPAGALRTVAGAGRGLYEGILATGVVQRVLEGGGTHAAEMGITVRALTNASLAQSVTELGVANIQDSAARLISALRTVPADGTHISYTRLKFNSLAAAKQTEGSAKAESTFTATAVSVAIDTYAHWTSVTRQGLSDHAGLQATINGLLVDGLLEKVSGAAFTGMTTAGNFTAFTPTASETAGDGIARAAAAVLAKGGTDVVVAVNPASDLEAQLQKASSSGVYLGLPPGLRARVLSTPDVTAGKVLAWSTDAVAWGDREQAGVQAGLQADNFTTNTATLLCELRGALLIVNPGRIYFGDLKSS